MTHLLACYEQTCTRLFSCIEHLKCLGLHSFELRDPNLAGFRLSRRKWATFQKSAFVRSFQLSKASLTQIPVWFLTLSRCVWESQRGPFGFVTSDVCDLKRSVNLDAERLLTLVTDLGDRFRVEQQTKTQSDIFLLTCWLHLHFWNKNILAERLL